jgi:hypothetical protein
VIYTFIEAQKTNHRGSFFSCYLQDFLEWRDPDSNRGHHDFSRVQRPLGMR